MNLPVRGIRGRTMAGIAIGAAVTFVVAVALLLQMSLSMVAKEATRIDDSRAKEAVHAALDMSLAHLASSVELNSVWDDAVTHAYSAKLDPTWFYSSYGALAKDDGDYDSIYIVDATGHIIWGCSHQNNDPSQSLGEVANGLEPALIAQTSWVGARPLTRLVATPYGPAFAGIGLIQPSSKDVALPNAKPRFLVLVRHIDAAVLSGYARAYGVGRLMLNEKRASGKNTARLSYELKGTDGSEIGRLTWDSRNTGIAAAHQVAPVIRMSLALLVIFSSAILCLVVWGLWQIRTRELEANRLARTDPLTELANRGAFLMRLHRNAKEPLRLAFVDMDHFKALNDGYGTTAGDDILIEFARRMGTYASENAFLGRLGGDLFGICVSGSDADIQLQNILSSFKRDLSLPFNIGASQVILTVTIGLASGSQDTPVVEMFRQATAALTHGKQFRRSGLTTYDYEIDQEIAQRLAIERQLREGLARNEFEVFYQPIVSAGSQTINSVEALVRWPRRPDGPLSPDVFIAIAERCGAIHELGLFVLKRACQDLLAYPHLQLSVNVSPAQFHDPRFLPTVLTCLKKSNFPANRLELEVTEGYMIELPDQAEKTIDALKSMGVSIALDDFGVGYSSIGYLRRFGFDKLKIDKSLASTIGLDSKAGALVAATVAIAQALGIPVTAEGVETAEQANLLHLAGCKNLQGYLFGRPASIEALALQTKSSQSLIA